MIIHDPDWMHDPVGPQVPAPRHPNAQDAVNFIVDTYIEAVHARVREAAEAAGLSEAAIAVIFGEEVNQ